MICVFCKSQFLYSQIKEICSLYTNEEIVYSQSEEDFKNKLIANKINIVFFDSEIFVDSARFRSLSPKTKFIVIARSGFETLLEKAILFGASDFILCPCLEQEVLDCL